MKSTRQSRTPWLGALAAGLVLAGSAPCEAGSEEAAQHVPSEAALRPEPSPREAPPAAQPGPEKADPLVYVPPDLGFPARRMGAGTRGMGRMASVQILAPDHLGYTTLEQPTLYWYLAEPTTTRIEFTIRDEASVEPLLERELPAPAQGGIQALRLADHGVRLRPGTRYLWFVSLVADPGRRSKDFTVGAWIARLVPDAALRERLAAAGGGEAQIYAQNGLWYDAIASLSVRIAGAPADLLLLERRAALLEQVGLSEVAAYERGRAAERP
jgi:hypothetical protein